MRNVLYGLLVCGLVAAGSSCGRKSFTKATIDTVYTHKVDTIHIKADTVAIYKVDSVVETVFMEVEKDCPQAKPETIVRWKKKIQETATMEALTGGELRGSTPDFKHNFRMIFKGNKPTVIWEQWQPTITIKEECPPCEKKKQKLSFWDKLSLIGGGILILLLGIGIGKIL